MSPEGSLREKIDRNAMSLVDDEESRLGKSGLFLTLSRINHDCQGNAEHQFMEHRGVKILVASRPIQKDEQIFISYTGFRKSREERKAVELSLLF